MGLSRQELFGKLLEQIHFPEKDNSAFRNAAVQSVVVHKKSRHWEFHLIFNKALPYDLFTQFNQSLQLGFKDIAKVSLKISTPMTELDESQLIIGSSSLIRQLVIHQCSNKLAYKRLLRLRMGG